MEKKVNYRAIAKKRWPKNCWIMGDSDSPWALVAHCGVDSVTLWKTEAEALESKATIDKTGCGGSCHKDHEIINLASN